MNLLDLMVKIGVDDQASKEIGGISSTMIAKATVIGNAFYDAAKFVGGKAVDMGKAIVGGAVEGYAAYEQLAGGIGKLYGNAGMELDEYAKSVGKSVDEVSADYERNEKAQKAMLEHAKDAYRTAGMDANTYMSSVTGFSSALINSLGGDTEKAAEIADMAMQDISDNANTFGKYTAEELTGVYQALAKGQYQTLDNLNLGFGGTKEGLQQLLDKAKELSGVDYSADSFADIAQAIHVIQENAKIAGTTTREAMGTIEGSVNMTKAAWDNLLISIGAGDTEAIGSAVSGIVDGIFGTFKEETGKREGGIINNVLPVLQNVGNAMVAQVPQLAESLAWNLIEAFNDTFGTDFDAETIMTNLENAFKTAGDRLGEVFDALSGAWDSFSSTFDTGYLSVTLENLQSIGEQVWGFVEQNILPNLPALGEVIGNVANFLGDLVATLTTVMDNLGPFVPAIVAAIGAVAMIAPIAKVIGLVSGAFTFLTTVIIPAFGMVQSFGGAIALLTTLLGGPITILVAVGAAIVAFIATNEDARNAIVDAWNAVVDFFAGLPEWWSGVWDSITEAVGNFVESVGKKWEDLKAKAKQTWENIKTAVVNTVLHMASSVFGKFRDLVGKVKEVWGNIKAAISDAINGAKDRVVEAAGNIYNGVKEKFQSVVDYVKGIPQRIKDAIGNLGGTLKDAGISLISGFWDGLKQKWEDVKSWLGGVADKAKKLKGPLPYDRKVLVENGEALMYGFQKGLSLGYERDVAPYLKGIAGDINSTMAFGTSGTMQGKAIGGGDVYNVYLSVEGSDSDQMAVEFTEALRTRSMLAGRVSTIEVRRR